MPDVPATGTGRGTVDADRLAGRPFTLFAVVFKLAVSGNATPTTHGVLL